MNEVSYDAWKKQYRCCANTIVHVLRSCRLPPNPKATLVYRCTAYIEIRRPCGRACAGEGGGRRPQGNPGKKTHAIALRGTRGSFHVRHGTPNLAKTRWFYLEHGRAGEKCDTCDATNRTTSGRQVEPVATGTSCNMVSSSACTRLL